MKVGLVLLMLTVLLVIVGILCFASDSVGWAQFLWVLASGTAGGAIVMFIDHWHLR